MTAVLPDEVRVALRALIWRKADELDWLRRPAAERSTQYENWAKDPEIGGVLAHFMDPRKIRVYVKDTLMKPYQRNLLRRQSGIALQALGLPSSACEPVSSFNQPHGHLMSDGSVICWGYSRDWKSIVFAVFERTYAHTGRRPLAAVLMGGEKMIEPGAKNLAQVAATRLGVQRLLWLD